MSKHKVDTVINGEQIVTLFLLWLFEFFTYFTFLWLSISLFTFVRLIFLYFPYLNLDLSNNENKYIRTGWIRDPLHKFLLLDTDVYI